MPTTSPLTPEIAQADRELAEARIEVLRAELEATPDRARQCVIQYEIGHIVQHSLDDEAMAVREYLGAYNLDPQFRPPLIALVQVFERRRSSKNLLRLYDAEVRGATTPREAASALADRAVLMADQLNEPEEARKLLQTAFEQAAEAPDLALLLEHQLLADGDMSGALAIIDARSDLVQDPVLSTLLRLEVARAHEDAGDPDAALRVLRMAVTTPAARWRVLEQLERVARRAQRYPELILALEGRAKLAAAGARGEDQGQSSGAFSVQRFADPARAASIAAAHYREAGRLRMTRLGDAAGALRDYDEALSVRPDDPVLRYERMLACELNGDVDGAAGEAQRLLDQNPEGSFAAALRFRLAEKAQAEGDAEGAIEQMRAALAADPGSAVAAAMLEDLLRATGEAHSVVALLESSGRAAEGESRAQRLFEAALLAADALRDADKARALFAEAAASAADPAPILREGLAAALRLSDAEGARAHSEALLDQKIDDEERSSLLRDLHELLRLVMEDDEAADRILGKALQTKAALGWAPDLARLIAAKSGNSALLSQAHRVLASRAADAETAAAHLCAAARADARRGADDAAEVALESALERSPGHPYALALMEEVLRARGDEEAVVRFLREAAEKADAPRAAETQLLLAGAAAEAGDDVERAVSAYREGAERAPTSFASMLALRRLAEGRNDQALLLEALQSLSEREIAAGEPGRHTLALGEHYDLFGGKPELAEKPLRLALESETVGLYAAVDLALLPVTDGDRAARLAGLTRILSQAGKEGRTGLLREAVSAALGGNEDLAKADELLGKLRQHAPNDRFAPIATLRLLATDPARASERADAWLALGHATDDGDVAAELLLQGLRSQAYGSDLGGKAEDAIDDAVIMAHQVMAVAPDSLAAAVALDESLSAGDDPEGRADALGSWLEQAGDAGKLALESARGRALAAAGRPREALEVLLRVAVRVSDDLASWEAIRVCARDCEAWEPLVESCDRLAHLLDDQEISALLLEESAAVLMDELNQDDRAERRLRRVLAIDAKRPIAFGRMHDLLAEREDDAGLLELVSSRIDLIDDPAELGKLYYEQARLLRSLGLREEALGALDNLLMLEAGHVGGLALLVELQVLRENWAGAVEALRSLARADDVPGTQRRIARLGAADFLENRLDDLEGALAELRALHESDLADREIYERMASVAERLQRFDEAAEALANAVESTSSPQTIARLERRAGGLHALDRLDREAAVAAYERALDAVPTDLAAGEALVELLEPPAREAVSRRFENALRVVLVENPTDAEALRKLRRAGAWRRDVGLESAALEALEALWLATEEEQQALEAQRQVFARAVPRGTLDPRELDIVRVSGDGGPQQQIAATLSESVSEMDGLEPSGFGMGRGDQVKGADPLKEELLALGGMFGVGQAELFSGGDAPTRIDVMPHYKGTLCWALGAGVQAPLSPDQRYTVGMLAWGARFGVAPFVRRGPEGSSNALFAAAVAAEAPLPAGEGSEGLEETTRRIYKAMPRRVRKALPDMLAGLGDDGRSIDAWAHATVRSAHHAGLLASNDLATGLRRVLGGEAEPEIVLASVEARDMLLFWLSSGALALRRKLGLTA